MIFYAFPVFSYMKIYSLLLHLYEQRCKCFTSFKGSFKT